MPKNGFPIPTAKNGFQILNLHPKNIYLKKILNANLLEKFRKFMYIINCSVTHSEVSCQ